MHFAFDKDRTRRGLASVGRTEARNIGLPALVDVTGAHDGVKELRSAFVPVRATEMGIVTSALYT